MGIPEKIGKYEISEQIGVGGFGAVFKGRDPFIKRTVAVKTCQLNDPEIKSRFFREAELAGNLHHRNITTIYDFGVENDVPYIVQEFLTGEDLDKVIKRGEKLPLSRKLEILIAIAEGLHFAHEAHVIHRDIKPANIRILENGTVKIMDFGIAKSLQSESSLTQTGITLGTSAYLAPEQIRGETLDRRTDVFALGVLAYELLAYQKPFRGEHLSTILYRILNEAPEPIDTIAPDVPPGLVLIVNKAIEKNIQNRYPSMEALRQDMITVYRQVAGGSAAIATQQTSQFSASASVRPGRDDQDPEQGDGDQQHHPALRGAGAPAGAGRSDGDFGVHSSARPRSDGDAVAEVGRARARQLPRSHAAHRRGEGGGGLGGGGLGSARRDGSRRDGRRRSRGRGGHRDRRLCLDAHSQVRSAGARACVRSARVSGETRDRSHRLPRAAGGQGRGECPETAAARGRSGREGEAGRETAGGSRRREAGPEEGSQPAKAKTFKVQFSSIPLATLFVDGKKIGPSIPAQVVELPEGKHTLRFETPDFPPYEKPFTVSSSGAPPIAYRFPVGVLVINSPAWAGANVLIDSKFKGILIGEKSFQVTSGSHKVTLSREGVNPFTAEVTVSEGEKKTLTPPAPTLGAGGILLKRDASRSSGFSSSRRPPRSSPRSPTRWRRTRAGRSTPGASRRRPRSSRRPPTRRTFRPSASPTSTSRARGPTSSAAIRRRRART